MAITNAQQARQLYQAGGGADMGGVADSQGNVGSSFGGGNGNEGGRNPMAQFKDSSVDTNNLTFMDEARKKVNPFGILTELPGVTGFLANAFTPNRFGFNSQKINPFVGGVEDASTNLPTWAKLGFSSEA